MNLSQVGRHPVKCHLQGNGRRRPWKPRRHRRRRRRPGDGRHSNGHPASWQSQQRPLLGYCLPTQLKNQQ